MIELPEAITLAKQLNESVQGKTVECVLPPVKPHKFCWFNGDAGDYEKQLKGSRAVSAQAFGIYAELEFDNGRRLCVNDGVNLRFLSQGKAPDNYQLYMGFSGGTALAFTVAMYGGIVLHDGSYDNEYYQKSRNAASPFGGDFRRNYDEKLAQSKGSLSAKAFLATEQRFPGIGNGTAQDILFAAGLNPRRKLSTMDQSDREKLCRSIIEVLGEMTEKGGRDTEKDLYGQSGGYKTRMSKAALTGGCPCCGSEIVKENYLGGSVYYCPSCQKL